MNAELAAQVTSARAVAADFTTTVNAYIDHDGVPEPNWQLMYFRLSCELRHLVTGLEGVLEAQQQAAGQAATLAAVRGVLDVFDWETDDRQYALEAIHRIVYARDDELTGP
jgi:hypothetical protein